MGDLVIKTHNFELAKKGLKEFSQKEAKDLQIKTVDEDGGLFGLGAHKVTGEELNERIATIQQHLIALNETNNKAIKEFGQVYKALEALDKDYIQAILISIKATEETSKGIAAAQEKITQVIEDQKKTLEILKKFKQKLDGYTHLGDIDKIWSDCQAWHEESSTLIASITAVTEASNENEASIQALVSTQKTVARKISEISDSLDVQIAHVETIIAFMDRLNAIVHLNDVDEMWDSLTNAQSDLQKLCAEIAEAQAAIANNAEAISKIQEFVDLLSRQEHLNDVDSIWYKTEEHNSQIASLQEQDETIKDIIKKNKENADKTASELQKNDEHLDELIQNNKQIFDQEVADLQEKDAAAMKIIEDNKLLAEQAIAEANEQTATMMQQLNKKLMYAYLIAGGSLVLAITELLIILLR